MFLEDIYNSLPPIKKYHKTLADIEKFNRADTVNMNEAEMNKFRHIAGPAYMTSEYYPDYLTRFFGIGKEAKDLKQGRGLKDTIEDLKNNEKGLIIGDANKDVIGSQKDLFNYIFETEIAPYRK